MKTKHQKNENKKWSTNKLRSEGVIFTSHNDGLHLIVKNQSEIIDFWPTTGKFISRKKGGKVGRGVHNLLKHLQDEEEGCMCCGQFPYYKDLGMCAACTFGEADAQLDLIDNGHNDPNVIYSQNHTA